MFCVELEALEHMSIYICVERDALEHMSFETFVLSMKIWRTLKDKFEVLGIIPGAFEVDANINL